MEYARIFSLGLVQVFLLAYQSRNAAQGRKLGYALTGLCISFVWAYLIRSLSLAGDDFWVRTTVYALGCVTGGQIGLWSHKKFNKKKRPEDW